jgi:hypothetical protein
MFSLHPCSRCYPLPSAGKDVVLRQKGNVTDGRDDLQIWTAAASILNTQSRTVDGVALPLGDWAEANNIWPFYKISVVLQGLSSKLWSPDLHFITPFLGSDSCSLPIHLSIHISEPVSHTTHFNPEDGGIISLRNVLIHLYKVSLPRRPQYEHNEMLRRKWTWWALVNTIAHFRVL